ncbi:hypothetical protein OPV22_006716 [Ensete ventricosum]|uniref:NAC domain-containing protein n=1 Tax=Ensete ventricosum TaxID=4639 RepID=A0AAV8RTR7_ENSVE|nr:hypothetical protein OPV22_006716 [Ensete ventricosum]
MADVSVPDKGDDCMDLPPGFRFHPMDEEIITHYLSRKIIDYGFTARAIGEVDLNRCEPWDLPSKAKMGEKDMYFFCQRDRKYPTGMRTNRATESGYWKATGKDKEIYRGKGVLVGMKKTLVFYKGRAPKGQKTNWVMHEFRLEGKYSLPNLPKSAKDEWVVCRIFHKNIGPRKSPPPGMERINSYGDDLLDSGTLPPLMDPPHMEYTTMGPGSSFTNNDQIFDFKALPPSFSAMMAMENQQVMNHHQMISNPLPHNPALLYAQPPPQSAYYSLLGSANPGYLHHDEAMMGAFAATDNDAPSAIRKHCKVEQYSNQSVGCPSQDTGLSTDRNTEISSVVSKHYVDDLDDPWTNYGF